MNLEFTLKGDWFLPSNKQSRLKGILEYNPVDGSRLELFGNFDNNSIFPEFKNLEIILGLTTDSRLITLYKCYINTIGGTKLVKGQESGKPSTFYFVNYVFIGAQIEKVEDFKFNSITSEIFNLDEWVNIYGFTSDKDYENFKNHEIKIHYKLPEQIKFEINKNVRGILNFTADSKGTMGRQKDLSINQSVEFQAISSIEMNLEEILHYPFRFKDFLILALYKNTFFKTIYLSGNNHVKKYANGQTEKLRIRLYFSSTKQDFSKKIVSSLNMLFNYSWIKERFPFIIKNWYEKYDVLKSSSSLLFEQFYKGNYFTENTFLNLAQAAETFHARLHSHSRMPKNEYLKMKTEVLSVTSTKYHEWLNGQFNFGNNLNLHDRLAELVEKYSNEVLDEIIGDKEIFIRQVKHSRNYYTHYSKSGEKKALKGQELFYLSEKLKVLLVLAFLIESGFLKDKLNKLFEDIKMRLFSHLIKRK